MTDDWEMLNDKLVIHQRSKSMPDMTAAFEVVATPLDDVICVGDDILPSPAAVTIASPEDATTSSVIVQTPAVAATTSSKDVAVDTLTPKRRVMHVSSAICCGIHDGEDVACCAIT